MTSLTVQNDARNTFGTPAGDRPVTEHFAGPKSLAFTRELTRLLFEAEARAHVHGPWRSLIANRQFRHRPELSITERMAHSYELLRLVNTASGDVEKLVRDPRRLAALHEWVGAVDGGLCTLVSIHYNLFLGSLLDHDDGHRDLSPYTELHRTGTFLCTELEHGNDAAALQTTATYERETGGFVLHTPTRGAQKFMPNTSTIGGPKGAVVAARLLIDGQDHGVYLFLVPLSDARGMLPGIRVRMLPSRPGPTVDHCLTSFHQVRLPREAMLQAEHGRLGPDGSLSSDLGNRRKRFLRSVGRVTTGKLCMSASSLGMARAALAIAVRYSHVRHISGPRTGERVPLAAHRSHHGSLLSALATAYAMTFLQRSSVTRWVEHDSTDRDEVERMIAVVKSWITWECRRIAIESRERCGAQGLFPLNGLADLASNIEGGITAEGDNLVIAVKAASEMIFGHRVEQTDEPVGRRNSPAPREALTDLRHLRDLLVGIEDLWQQRSRAALRRGPKGDPLGRWNAVCPAALEMVYAHARRLAADAFLAAVEQAAEPRTRQVLETLCRLFMLQELSPHTGQLMAEGRLDPEYVRALPSAVDNAIAQLAPHMMDLVDAFDLPSEFFNDLPIANSDVTARFDELVSAFAQESND